MKTMSATIEISAPPLAVWAVLTDLSRYPEWNPLFREAEGEIAAGKRIRLRSVHPASGRLMTVKPRIVTAEPGVELRWTSSLPGIMSGEHAFALSPAGSGTRLDQSENFRGLLVPFSGKILARAEAGFRALNEAIKKRAAGTCRRLLIVHHTPSPAMQAMFEASWPGRARGDRARRGGDPAGADRGRDGRAGRRRLPARHACEHRVHVRRAEALLRRDVLPRAWRPTLAGRTGCTCTGTTTPAERSGRWSRSLPG